MKNNLSENVEVFVREHMSTITSACSVNFLEWLLERVPETEFEIRDELKKAISAKISSN